MNGEQVEDGEPKSSEEAGRAIARCPNCGEAAIDAYESGSGEYDCRNSNCRCMVFRAEGNDGA